MTCGPLRRLGAALSAGFALAFLSPPAHAGPQELTDHVRLLLETGDLPETADDAAIEIVDNGNHTKLTGRQLKAAFVEQLRATTGYKLKEFKVDAVECRDQACSISYDFRA